MGVLALLVVLGMLIRTSETRPVFNPGGQHSTRVSNDSAPGGLHYEQQQFDSDPGGSHYEAPPLFTIPTNSFKPLDRQFGGPRHQFPGLNKTMIGGPQGIQPGGQGYEGYLGYPGPEGYQPGGSLVPPGAGNTSIGGPAHGSQPGGPLAPEGNLTGQPDGVEALKQTFTPIAQSISIFFLLLTFCCYAWFDHWNTNEVVTRMTMTFLANMAVAYIFSVCVWLGGSDVTARGRFYGTALCKVSGFCIQYFYLSFLFWISALGFNIWRMFKTLKKRHGNSKGNLRKFLLYALYAQGTPLLICVLTAILDSLRPDGKSTLHFPNMGIYSCFIGESEEVYHHYFGSARFIYFDLFMLIILLSNTFFLGAVCIALWKGWKNQQVLGGPAQTQRSDQAAIVVRLFIILGIPWALEMLSSALHHELKTSASTIVFISDLATLFQGLLIFLTLVVKKSALKDMWRQSKSSMARLRLLKTTEDSEMTQASNLSGSSTSGS